MAVTYEFNEYFAKGKTRYWAEYVDKKENGGNNNHKVDGNEIQLFKDIIKHRYNYNYDFNKADSEQSNELELIETRAQNTIAEAMYSKSKLNNKWEGALGLGNSFGSNLAGTTNDYRLNKSIIEKLNTFPVKAKKYDVLKNFLLGYAASSAGNGIFEQMASEYGGAFKNKDVVPFMKTLLDNVPQNKRNTKEFKFLEQTYNEYKAKPQNDKFENSKYSYVSRIFGCDTLDKLDEAIEKLYDI